MSVFLFIVLFGKTQCARLTNIPLSAGHSFGNSGKMTVLHWVPAASWAGKAPPQHQPPVLGQCSLTPQTAGQWFILFPSPVPDEGMMFPSPEALEGCARGVFNHPSPTGLTLPPKKASERLPHHHLLCWEQNTGTQWGCVLGSCNFSFPRVHLQGWGSSSQRKYRTSNDCPQHHPGLTMACTAQQTLGRKASGYMGSPQVLTPHCSLQFPASILMPAG